VQAPSGRVTAVPDRRLIRWYTTIGLLDRPLPTRGRVARYGERHLLQLVAVKRRQAQGRSLAEIQAELAGATDAMLYRAAGLPQAAAIPRPTAGLPDVGASQERDGFWRAAVGAFHAPAPVVEAPVPPVYPVALPAGVTLVLHAAPTPEDLAAIRTAAQPLLDLLADRGLVPEPPLPPGRPQ
jgi:MerR HTH family regulatory protein